MIELDTSLSFELDDFDPLKPNAKQLPMSVSAASRPHSGIQFPASGTPTPTAASTPVYPFYTPPGVPATPPPIPPPSTTSTPKLTQFDEDLLRNFGLHNLIISSRSYSDHTKAAPYAANRNTTHAGTTTPTNGFRPASESRDLVQPPSQARNNNNNNNTWTTFD